MINQVIGPFFQGIIYLREMGLEGYIGITLFDVLLGNEVEDPLGPSPRGSDMSGFDAVLARVKDIHGLT